MLRGSLSLRILNVLATLLALAAAARGEVEYAASEAEKNPVSQAWVALETTEPGTDADEDGRIDSPANVGPVEEGGQSAWQVADQNGSSTLNLPIYYSALDFEDLRAFYENGWTFEAEVKAVDASGALSSGFTGWGFNRATTGGSLWPISNAVARIGFTIGIENPNDAPEMRRFRVLPTVGDAIVLEDGSAGDFHTLRAVGLPRTTKYQLFIDEVSHGFFNFSEAGVAGLTADKVVFGGNSSANVNEVTSWRRVSLAGGPEYLLSERAERLSREFSPHFDSMIGNGVDGATGSFTQAIDLVTVTGLTPISVTAVYDSQLTYRAGPMGYGWSHNFEARAVIADDWVDILWDANRKSRFLKTEVDGVFEAEDEDMQYVELVLAPDQIDLYLLDGTRYMFGADGLLNEIRNAADQSLLLWRDDAGRLSRIEDKITSVRVYFNYSANGLLTNFEDSEGRVVNVRYDDRQRLVRVSSPTVFDERDAAASGLPRAIPDAASGNSLLVEMGIVDTQGVAGPTHLLNLVITHDSPEDLDVSLISPANREVSYTEFATASGNQLTLERWGLPDFEGDPIRGTWKLKVTAKNGATGGQLESAELKVYESLRNSYFTYEDGDFPGAGRLIKAEDGKRDRVFANAFDAIGRVVEQDDALDETPLATISYSEPDADGRIETLYTSSMGFESRLTHAETFRLKRAENALGQVVTIEHDEAGNVVKRTDARGNSVTLGYDESGRVISYIDEAGSETTFTYHSGLGKSRSVATITDELGNEGIIEYQGRASLSNAKYNAVRVLRAEYHDDNQLKRIVRNEYAKIDYYLDARGRISKVGHPESEADPQSGVGAEKEYDRAGRVVVTRDYEDRATLIEYTDSSEIARTTDPDGNATVFDFDYRGRLISSMDARGKTTRYSYDANNNLLAMTNPLGAVTQYEYDHDNRVTAVVEPSGARTTYTYDAIGQVTELTDPLGRVAKYEYDELGNVVTVYDAEGKLDSAIEYDDRGYVTKVSDGFGNETRAEYDPIRRRTKVIEANGYERRFDYSTSDRAQYAYDSMKRRAFAAFNGQKGGSPSAVEVLPYDHDDPEPPDFTETEGEGLFLLFRHDYANNLTEQDDGQVTYSYNDDNQLELAYVGSVVNVNYSYDGAGRMEFSTTTGSGGRPEDERDRQYLYDENANLVEVRASERGADDYETATRRIYDDAGRLSAFIDQQGSLQSYGYDLNDNLTSVTYPDGKKVSYEYDAADRLVKVTDWADRVTTIKWSESDRVTEMSLPNGVTRKMAYNRLGQLVSREDVNEGGVVLLSYKYQYNEIGKIVAEIAYPTEPPPISESVASDYDLDWNRMQDIGGLYILRDFGGHVIEVEGFREIDYSRRGRMNETERYDFFYDEEDNLVGWQSVENPARQTSFVVNPVDSLNQVIASSETDGAETKKSLFVYGLGLLYEEIDGEPRYYHQDYRGSTVALSNAQGEVIGRMSYDPYGRIASRSGETDTMFLYNGLFGCITSPEEMVYMRFRWYWPMLRQFTSRDAYVGDISDFSSLNYFTYAGGDPISRVDPEGEFWWVAVGAVVGAAANTIATFVADVADDGKINTAGERYAAAAIGGAVTGMIVAGTGGLGGAMLGGAAGAATENLVFAAMTGQKVDPVSLAIDSAVGGAAGGVGHGTAKVASKVGGRVYARFGTRFASKAGRLVAGLFRPEKVSRRAGVYGAKELLKRSFKKELAHTLGEGIKKGAAKSLSAPLVVALETYFSSLVPGTSGGSSGGGGGKGVGATEVWIRHHRGGELDKEKRLGIYRLFDLYVEALDAAGHPIVNSPNYSIYNL